MGVIDKFLPLVMDADDEGMMSPILVTEKATFVYIKYNNLYSTLLHFSLLTSLQIHHAPKYFTARNIVM